MKAARREEHSRKDKCKHPEAGACWQVLGNGEEASVAELRVKNESVGDEVRETDGREGLPIK